jgi:hypothetical protein
MHVRSASYGFALPVVDQWAVHAAQILGTEDEAAVLPILGTGRAVDYCDGRSLWTFRQ